MLCGAYQSRVLYQQLTRSAARKPAFCSAGWNMQQTPWGLPASQVVAGGVRRSRRTVCVAMQLLLGRGQVQQTPMDDQPVLCWHSRMNVLSARQECNPSY